MKIQWSSAPSIKEVSQSEADTIISLFQSNYCLEEWCSEQSEAGWNTRVKDALNLLEWVTVDEQATLYAYILNYKPVALALIYWKRDSLYLDLLVSHPGVSAGEIMIEYLVNLAEHNGKKGCIVLRSFENANTFYTRLGFIRDGKEFKLDPAISPLWIKAEDNSWRVAKHLTKKPMFITGFSSE